MSIPTIVIGCLETMHANWSKNIVQNHIIFSFLLVIKKIQQNSLQLSPNLLIPLKIILQLMIIFCTFYELGFAIKSQLDHQMIDIQSCEEQNVFYSPPRNHQFFHLIS